MTASTLLGALAAEEVHRELPLPAWGIGLIAFGILLLLLMITLQFNRDR